MTSHAITKPRLTGPHAPTTQLTSLTTGPVTSTTALTVLAPGTYKHDMSIVRPRDYVTCAVTAVKRTFRRLVTKAAEFDAAHHDENVITGSILAISALTVALTILVMH